jgi:hypothetical protein
VRRVFYFYAPSLPCTEFYLEQLGQILQRFDHFEFQVLAALYKEDRQSDCRSSQHGDLQYGSGRDCSIASTPHVVDITTPELLTPSSSDLLVSPERMLTWQVRLPTLLPPPQIQAKIPEPITSRSSLLDTSCHQPGSALSVLIQVSTRSGRSIVIAQAKLCSEAW